ncbi:hypothetical protein C923_00183 [Plasmodium falciparum UGT5.1]|uniref:Uncharacterized protein n=1 Tax=Plasmodium falciparum UGT5.1 TaxID=1237627 RepID=W7JVJ1_PLAFA|nr:hypothetical protein C923_00183 [Plasmodium falciparum UGT5.1]
MKDDDYDESLKTKNYYPHNMTFGQQQYFPYYNPLEQQNYQLHHIIKQQQNYHPHHIIKQQQNHNPHHILQEQEKHHPQGIPKEQPYNNVPYILKKGFEPKTHNHVKEDQPNIKQGVVKGQEPHVDDMHNNTKEHKNFKNTTDVKQPASHIYNNSSEKQIEHVYNKHTNNISLEKQNSHKYNVNIQDRHDPVYYKYEDMLKRDKDLFTIINNICELEFNSTNNYLMKIINNDKLKHNSLNDNEAILKEITKTQNELFSLKLPLEIKVSMALRISERLRAFVFDKDLTAYYIKKLKDIFKLETEAAKNYYYYVKCQKTFSDKKRLVNNLDSIKLYYESQINKNFISIPKDKIPTAIYRISNLVNDLIFLLPQSNANKAL